MQALSAHRNGLGSQVLHLNRPVSSRQLDAIGRQMMEEMLKNQAIDEGPMTLEASQALYRTEAPIWAELIAGLGLEPM